MSQKDIKDLKKDIQPLFNKIYSKGGRGIRITNRYVEGYVIEQDLSRYPKKVITKKIRYLHHKNLKDYGISLKRDQFITVGGSHIYVA